MTSPDPDLLGADAPWFSGWSEYLDDHPSYRDNQSRIFVKFQPEGAKNPRVALLDTGAHYCMLESSLVEEISPFLTDSVGQIRLRTAHGLVHGDLHILKVTLIAEVGESLDVDAIAFVSKGWRGPSFIGYTGLLDRLRFAVDPQLNRFYFAPL